MNLISFIMAIPIGIAMTSLFTGVLLLLAYYHYKITGNDNSIANLIHILNRHYMIIFIGSFLAGYGLAICFIYYKVCL